MSGPSGSCRRSAKTAAKKPVKKKLVAFALERGFSGEVPNECNLVIESGVIKGRTTSISYSQYLDRYIGFAYVNPEKASAGDKFQIRTDSGAMVTATVVKTPFINHVGD